MRADHPHTDPGDGRTECETCGKWVWLVTHSCKRVPVTPAAIARHQERLAMTATDPLAHERFRTILAEAVRSTGYDAYADGQDADPDVAASKVLALFPDARFQLALNEHGVKVRRLVIHGEWEVNPTPASSTERIAQKFLTDTGSRGDDGEHVLRQKLTALAFHASATAALGRSMSVGGLALSIHKTLSGEIDPREHVSQLRTVEAGHVGSDRHCPECHAAGVPADHLCTLI